MKREKILYGTMLCVFLAVILGLVRPAQAQNVKIGGAIDVDLFGAKLKGEDSSSDIKLDLLELSVQSELNEHVSANALVKYEYEDNPGAPTDYSLVVDEAYITLTKLTDQPLSVMAGKWYLPFGVFNNSLCNDPLTEDAFEINAPAVSFGFAPEEVEGLDLSLTAYSNKDARWANPANPPEDDLGNYILNASFTQAEFYTLSVFFDSERGIGDRNRSLGASLSTAFLEGLTFDAEYIKAVKRDVNNPEDSAYSVSGAFKVLPPLELVGRFEGYDDGVDGDQTFGNNPANELEGLENRISAGANYELFEHAVIMAELRVSTLEDEDISPLQEGVLRLHVEF